MRSDRIFKYFVSSLIIADIAFLGAMVFTALEEYDELLWVETIGIAMVGVAAAVGIGALLFSFYGILKWKPFPTGIHTRI